MLFRFDSSDGNDPNSVACLQMLINNADSGFQLSVPLWFLGSAFNNMPHFNGFTPGQLFEIDIKAVKIKIEEVPVTDGRDILPQ